MKTLNSSLNFKLKNFKRMLYSASAFALALSSSFGMDEMFVPEPGSILTLLKTGNHLPYLKTNNLTPFLDNVPPDIPERKVMLTFKPENEESKLLKYVGSYIFALQDKGNLYAFRLTKANNLPKCYLYVFTCPNGSQPNLCSSYEINLDNNLTDETQLNWIPYFSTSAVITEPLWGFERLKGEIEYQSYTRQWHFKNDLDFSTELIIRDLQSYTPILGKPLYLHSVLFDKEYKTLVKIPLLIKKEEEIIYEKELVYFYPHQAVGEAKLLSNTFRKQQNSRIYKIKRAKQWFERNPNQQVWQPYTSLTVLPEEWKEEIYNGRHRQKISQEIREDYTYARAFKRMDNNTLLESDFPNQVCEYNSESSLYLPYLYYNGLNFNLMKVDKEEWETLGSDQVYWIDLFSPLSLTLALQESIGVRSLFSENGVSFSTGVYSTQIDTEDGLCLSLLSTPDNNAGIHATRWLKHQDNRPTFKVAAQEEDEIKTHLRDILKAYKWLTDPVGSVISQQGWGHVLYLDLSAVLLTKNLSSLVKEVLMGAPQLRSLNLRNHHFGASELKETVLESLLTKQYLVELDLSPHNPEEGKETRLELSFALVYELLGKQDSRVFEKVVLDHFVYSTLQDIEAYQAIRTKQSQAFNPLITQDKFGLVKTKSLDLRLGSRPLEFWEIFMLTSEHRAPHLTSLVLNQVSNLPEDYIKLISENLTSLTNLEMRANHIDAEKFKTLARGKLTNLHSLNVSGENIGEQGAAELTKENFPALTSLDLSGCLLNQEVAKRLASGINLSTLKNLCLYRTSIKDEGVIAIANGDFINLESLELGDVGIEANGFVALMTSSKLVQLTTLGINHSNISSILRIGALGGQMLLSSLSKIKLPKITDLNISYQHIGPEGARAIGQTLTTLTKLDAHGNNLGPVGIQYIVSGNLFNLASLGVEGNKIEERGAEILANANLTNLTSLFICCNPGIPDNNNIGINGIQALKHSQSLSKLKTLYIGYGPDYEDYKKLPFGNLTSLTNLI